jgi:uncharacterized protein DUF433
LSVKAPVISIEEILADYPCLEREDVLQALRYAAWLPKTEKLSDVSALARHLKWPEVKVQAVVNYAGTFP